MSNFIIEDKDKVLIKYKGKGEKVVTIPNDPSNKVTEIGDMTFYDCRKLENIVISNSVKEIGKNVFAGCNNLKNVTAPAKFKDTLLKELGNKVTFN